MNNVFTRVIKFLAIVLSIVMQPAVSVQLLDHARRNQDFRLFEQQGQTPDGILVTHSTNAIQSIYDWFATNKNQTQDKPQFKVGADGVITVESSNPTFIAGCPLLQGQELSVANLSWISFAGIMPILLASQSISTDLIQTKVLEFLTKCFTTSTSSNPSAKKSDDIISQVRQNVEAWIRITNFTEHMGKGTLVQARISPPPSKAPPRPFPVPQTQPFPVAQGGSGNPSQGSTPPTTPPGMNDPNTWHGKGKLPAKIGGTTSVLLVDVNNPTQLEDQVLIPSTSNVIVFYGFGSETISPESQIVKAISETRRCDQDSTILLLSETPEQQWKFTNLNAKTLPLVPLPIEKGQASRGFHPLHPNSHCNEQWVCGIVPDVSKTNIPPICLNEVINHDGTADRTLVFFNPTRQPVDDLLRTFLEKMYPSGISALRILVFNLIAKSITQLRYNSQTRNWEKINSTKWDDISTVVSIPTW
ncbi:MAG: hypothetical protein LBF65_02545 [Holosporales bacterium]|nr:hypothetical protein [Holosporales bacterium]